MKAEDELLKIFCDYGFELLETRGQLSGEEFDEEEKRLQDIYVKAITEKWVSRQELEEAIGEDEPTIGSEVNQCNYHRNQLRAEIRANLSKKGQDNA